MPWIFSRLGEGDWILVGNERVMAKSDLMLRDLKLDILLEEKKKSGIVSSS